MSSLERIHEYTTSQQTEPKSKNFQDSEKTQNFEKSEIWPKSGKIKFDNFKIKYRENLPYVLKGIDLLINPGEKIAVVGRTGSGKSTLILALMRILEYEETSKIFIDDVDISKLDLYDLRNSICVIPQEPFLLEGTLQFSIDPFNKHKKDEILAILKKINFVKTLQNFEKKFENCENSDFEKKIF